MRKEIDEVVRSGTKTDREMVERFEAAHRKAIDDFRRILDAHKEEAAVEACRHEYNSPLRRFTGCAKR